MKRIERMARMKRGMRKSEQIYGCAKVVVLFVSFVITSFLAFNRDH